VKITLKVQNAAQLHALHNVELTIILVNSFLMLKKLKKLRKKLRKKKQKKKQKTLK